MFPTLSLPLNSPSLHGGGSTPPYPPPSPSISSTQVLRSILPIKDEDVVVGQYRGYTDDPTVPDGSKTPTYATVVLHINNERWDGERS